MKNIPLVALKNDSRYPTGVVATYLNIKPKTLINFEVADLTKVKKNLKNRRLYSQNDIFIVILILFLLNKKGANYKGCKQILKLLNSPNIDQAVLTKIISKKRIINMIKKASSI